MVMARLHVICGNCGNGDKREFRIRINTEPQDPEDPQTRVYLSCKNCHTLHALDGDLFEEDKKK